MMPVVPAPNMIIFFTSVHIMDYELISSLVSGSWGVMQ